MQRFPRGPEVAWKALHKAAVLVIQIPMRHTFRTRKENFVSKGKEPKQVHQAQCVIIVAGMDLVPAVFPDQRFADIMFLEANPPRYKVPCTIPHRQNADGTSNFVGHTWGKMVQKVTLRMFHRNGGHERSGVRVDFVLVNLWSGEERWEVREATVDPEGKHPIRATFYPDMAPVIERL